MPPRKKKPHWSVGLPKPPWAGGPEHVVKPAPATISPSHSTSAHYGPSSVTPPADPEWQCMRCERIRDGLFVDGGLDHTRRCPYRGTGRDPELKG